MRTRRYLGALALGLLIALPMAAQTSTGAQPVTPDAQRVVGAPANQPLAGAALDRETSRVSALLRCPVCQGLSVNDSPATMAVNMKHQVRELLAAGYSGEQILNYFEKSYGEFVLLQPPLRGVNWLVWIIPVLIAVGGAWGVWRFLKKSGATDEVADAELIAENLPGRDTLPEDPELAPWVLKARELAYGWPGGRSPEAAGGAEGDR
jgi:cytochrome c-type biogenesis protein CcmH